MLQGSDPIDVRDVKVNVVSEEAHPAAASCFAHAGHGQEVVTRLHQPLEQHRE